MALPPNGRISLIMIMQEFNSTSRNLRAFYRGAGIVPNTPINAKVPTSGRIALRDFYGASRVPPITVTISATSIIYNDALNPSVTCGASGGQPPYSFFWEKMSGWYGIGVRSPNAATTSFFNADILRGRADEAMYRCKVTDSLGSVNYSPHLIVAFHFAPAPAPSPSPSPSPSPTIPVGRWTGNYISDTLIGNTIYVDDIRDDVGNFAGNLYCQLDANGVAVMTGGPYAGQKVFSR